MLQALKAFDASKHDVEELISLAAHADGMVVTFRQYDLEVPEWLTNAKQSIDLEVKARARDQLEKELKETELALDRLKSRDERREELRGKQERLRNRLGK